MFKFDNLLIFKRIFWAQFFFYLREKFPNFNKKRFNFSLIRTKMFDNLIFRKILAPNQKLISQNKEN